MILSGVLHVLPCETLITEVKITYKKRHWQNNKSEKHIKLNAADRLCFTFLKDKENILVRFCILLGNPDGPCNTGLCRFGFKL